MLHTFHIDGHSLAARLLNPGAAGEPIILLHGLGHSIDFWRREALLTGYGPCYALSLPGHYPARAPAWMQPGDLSAELIVRLLAAAIAELTGGRPATLAGISTGGFAALALAERHPGLASKLICVSGFSHGRWTGVLAEAQRLARGGPLRRRLLKLLFQSGRRSRRSYAALWPQFVADFARVRRDPAYALLLDDLHPNASRLDLEQFATYCQRMPELDITARLAGIDAPALILAGAADPLVDCAQSRRIAALMPNATLAIIADAGHFVALEQPAAYRDVLTAWLDYQTAGAPSGA